MRCRERCGIIVIGLIACQPITELLCTDCFASLSFFRFGTNVAITMSHDLRLFSMGVL